MTKKSINALDALLAAEVDAVESVFIKRLGVDFTVKAITSEAFDGIEQQAKGADGKVDDSQLNGALIAAACVDPNFNDAALRERYGVPSGAAVANRALLAGETVKLVEKIMEISGFDKDIESAKN